MTQPTTIRFDADDPRWTAYALGEIDDAAERAAIEAELERSGEARAFVDSIRETGDLLTAELAGAEPQVGLTDIQRQKIKQAADAPQPAPSVAPSRRGYWLAGGAVAAAAVIVSVAVGGGAKKEMVQSTGDTGVALEGKPEETIALATPTGEEVPADGDSRDGIKGQANLDPGKYALDVGGDNSAAGRPTSTSAPQFASRLGKNRVGQGFYARQAGEAGAMGKLKVRPGPGDGRYQPDADQQNSKTDLPNRESYSHTRDNPFTAVAKDPRSTFSIDVDTGSYSNIRRMLQRRQLPPIDSVRIEEMINYFDYEYPQPQTEHPFSLAAEIGRAPWNRENLLVKVGVQGKELTQRARPRANLVFLVDVSGSMSAENKLPLLKRGIGMLVKSLDPEDRVAVVVYAGAAGLVLPSTPVSQRRKIMRALDRLNAGGSTNGGAGIELAYKVAAQNFVQGGVNRVLLATDGDFNVGTSDTGGLVRLVEKKAKTGVFLTVLGFGMGNYNDAMLEEISNKGNGHYAYIDTINEARKVLVHELDSTLVTIAKDVKIQVEFNPKRVARYRLIGYANRILAHRDFDDDTKDAGEIGAGHSVTALYEIVPAKTGAAGASGGLKYQTGNLTAAADANELMNLKLRYKKPDGDTSKLVEVGIPADVSETPSRDFNLASGVAAFGMLLRRSEHRGDASYAQAIKLVRSGVGRDLFGYRGELLELIGLARSIDRR